jgi:hypothetical protein
VTRKFSSISVESTLASGISNSQTTLTVATGTGSALLGGVTLAAGNVDQFTLALDPDTNNEEIVFATAVAADTFTIVRARAGSSGVTHSGGATVRHVLTSDDLTFFTTGVATADAAVPKSTLTTTGDTFYASSANTPARLAIGSAGQVLTVASGIPSWATPTTLNLTINAKTASYPLVAGDVNKLLTMSSTSTTTFTVPNGVFTTGQQINVQGIGTGLVQIRNDGTTTLTSTGATSGAPDLRAQYSAATIICTGTNTFTVIGDLA